MMSYVCNPSGQEGLKFEASLDFIGGPHMSKQNNTATWTAVETESITNQSEAC